MSWHASEALMNTIKHYASFPATGVSLRQMVQFGARPSTGKMAHSVLSLVLVLYAMAMKDLADVHGIGDAQRTERCACETQE
jgi:hypothetical protein